MMRKHILLLSLGFLISSSLLAQIQEVPIVFNPALSAPSKARSVADNVLPLYVATNAAETFCAEDLVESFVATATFKACSAITFGALSVSGTCMTYRSNGTVGTDEICLEVCDSLANCEMYTLQISSKRALAIPFVDDFSYRGPYPDEELWLDRDVYINYSLAERPLGLGVATFDGLDPTGSPYDRLEGLSDVLTSNFIAATGATNVFISFFFQPRGFGIGPRTRDSLSLDIRDAEGRWRNVWAKDGLPSSVSRFDPTPDFEFVKVPVADSLLSNTFQIRFRNRSSQRGLQQLWHIDYVKLSEELEPEINFEDLAFRNQPNGILRNYTAMPYRHFMGFEDDHVRDSFDISLYSHFNDVSNANPSRMDILRTEPSSTLISNLALLLPAEISPDGRNQRNLASGQHDFRNSLRRAEVLDAVRGLDNREATLGITTVYGFQQDQESNQGIPAFLRNNTTTFTNVFSNYLAYDDGTAESGLKAENNTGLVTIAQEYSTNVDDQLQGVQFFFPRVEGDANKLRFNLLVWIGELDDEPDFIQESVQPLYVDQFFDTIQGYTTYNLLDTGGNKVTLDIPAGKFYVGWQQVRSAQALDLSVGLDKNRPGASQFIYYRVNDGSWINVGEAIQTISGALMIRPILDDEEVISTDIPEVERIAIQVFPNPASQVLYIQTQEDISTLDYHIYSMAGRLVRNGPLNPQIEVNDLPPGSYLLAVLDRSGAVGFTQKLHILR